MTRATRADELAEQIAVLYGWAPIHVATEREKALSELWHEWATERGGYLKEHRELTDERIAELANRHDERAARLAPQVAALVTDGPPLQCPTGKHDWYVHEYKTPCYGWDGEINLPPGTVHCRSCFKVKGARRRVSA